MSRLSPILLSLLAAATPGPGGEAPAPVRLKALRVSPACTLVQDVGISQIRLAFARPSVKGRPIWNALVPYGEVWRAGANAATVLTLSHPAKVEGHEVPAGSYAFFVLPGAGKWTLILSRKSDQWGAYDYKPADDQLRWEATPGAGPFLEALDYRILPLSPDAATVELGWEKVRVAFTVAFDTPGLYGAHLTETLARAPKDDWVPWFQAAAYCQERGLEPVRAMAWIDASLAARETFWNHETKARLLKAAGRKEEALVHLGRAVELSRGKAPREWTDKTARELEDWRR
jgi:hypothetical protein